MALEIEAKFRANDSTMGCGYRKLASGLINLLRTDQIARADDLQRALAI